MFRKEILDPLSKTRLLIKMHYIDCNISDAEKRMKQAQSQEAADFHGDMIDIGLAVKQLMKKFLASKLNSDLNLKVPPTN